MKTTDTKDVKKKIRTLLYHVGALQGSYPKVLEDPEYARAHLLVLRQVLPYMMHVLRFSTEMVPLLEKVVGLAGQGSEQLGDVSKNLRNIDSTTENAVQQILTGLEEVEDQLRKVQAAAGVGEDVEAAIESTSGKLLDIFGVLQFQDIASQKIEATNALLAQLERQMNSLVEHLGMPVEGEEIKVREGTFDSRAEYDVEKAGAVQRAVDAVVDAVRQEAEATAGDPKVGQGEIDALLGGT